MLIFNTLKYNDAYELLISWLGKCNEKRRLAFTSKSTLRYMLKNYYKSERRYRPIGKEKLKEQLPEIYNILFVRVVPK